MTKKDLQQVERKCHAWLSIHDPEYRRAYLQKVLMRHALKKAIQTCLKPSTLSILKTITTPK